MNPERPKRPLSMDGFRQQRPSPSRPSPSVAPEKRPLGPPPESKPQPEQQAPSDSPAAPPEVEPKKTRRPRHIVRTIIIALIALIALALIALYALYRYELTPVSESTKTQSFVVKAGATPHQIADSLEEQHLIRSSTAFYVYLLISQKRDTLQAGSYELAPSKSVADIVDKLAHGAVSDFSVTFYPGGTLNGDLRMESKYSVLTQLKNAGFSAVDIRDALAMRYDMPALFSGKPANSSLEGYIYGDTYNFAAGTKASDVITRSLKEFTSVVTENDLKALYKKQGLSLYQGITLASIVQREIDEKTADGRPTKYQKQVAQVFLLRLKKDMPLGADATYLYGAEQLGVTPTPNIDSPYNTRKNTGLPPGPIAVPGLASLLAVAHPAQTDYLYFVSGDDGKTYFSKTNSEHVRNVKNHCHKKCQY